jgi:paraquat-inducible protein B
MEVEEPQVTTRSGVSIVWLIPIITLMVGGWLVFKTLSEVGPVATISFRTAEGIVVGRTMIKYKSVDIGVVEGVQFSEDLNNVILTAQFNQGTAHLLKRNTRFWVVRPELSLRGASGLSTLISGSYIELDPGPGAEQRHFVGLEEKPVVTADEAGTRIVLISDKLGSIDAGSPVYYQGLQAGEVLGHELANDRRSVYIHVFIKDPYNQLIRGNSRFWNVSGMEVSMDTDGFSIKTESFASMLFGGVAFETPASLDIPTEEVENLVFSLFDSYESILENAFTKKINFVMFFDSSVRGLSIGAPVEFKGIKVGSVLDIRLEYDSNDTSFRIPVLIEIEPERIIERETQQVIEPVETMDKLIEEGLRARLQTGSLLTGQLFVELGIHPETEIVMSGDEMQFPELPTIEASNFNAITASIQDFVSRMENIQIEEIGEVLLNTLQGADRLINSNEIENAMQDLETSLDSLSSILYKVDQSNLREAIDAGHVALESLDTTLNMATRVLKPNSPLQYNVIEMTDELTETARAIRALVETLERNPQALIFGKDTGGDE